MKELIVGEVLKPQGIRGELKLKPFTDSAEEFLSLKRIFLDGEEFKILSARTGGGMVYLGLRGVPDRNAAELLRTTNKSMVQISNACGFESLRSFNKQFKQDYGVSPTEYRVRHRRK